MFPNIPIGFELEYEGVDYYSDGGGLKNILGQYGYVKGDGSLNYGFELASNVYKFSDFTEGNIERWEILFNKIKELGAYSNQKTGMHIHVGRSHLSKDEISKINYFIFSSRKLMDFVGGRKSNSYSAYIRNDEYEIENNNGAKYRYLNIGHKNSIEFRFFKCPEELDRFLVNIQFIISIISFVKSSRDDIEYFKIKRRGNLIKYSKFLLSNKEKLPNLYSFLKNNLFFDKIKKLADNVINCNLYPTQKSKVSLIKMLLWKFGSTSITREQLENLINSLNPEKAPKTIEHLSKTLERANKRGAEIIYFNNILKLKNQII